MPVTDQTREALRCRRISRELAAGWLRRDQSLLGHRMLVLKRRVFALIQVGAPAGAPNSAPTATKKSVGAAGKAVGTPAQQGVHNVDCASEFPGADELVHIAPNTASSAAPTGADVHLVQSSLAHVIGCLRARCAPGRRLSGDGIGGLHMALGRVRTRGRACRCG